MIQSMVTGVGFQFNMVKNMVGMADKGLRPVCLRTEGGISGWIAL
jgi:hypothetical protein